MKRLFVKFLPLMAAVLFATSCSKDDNGDINNNDITKDEVIEEQKAQETPTNIVPISITVGKNAQSTSKSTVEDGAEGLVQKFISGDVLEITGDVLAEASTLTLKSGDENKTTATFIGELKLKDGVELVKGTTKLNAVLKNNSTEHPNSGTALTEICQVTSLEEGFEKYGYLTAKDFVYNGEATSISLVQNTAFLEFKTVMSRVPQVMVNGTYYAVEGGLCYLAVPDKTTIKCGLLSEKKTVDVSTGKVVYTIDRTAEKYKYMYDFSVAADNILALTMNADLVIIGEKTDEYYDAIGTALRSLPTDVIFKLDFSRSDYFTSISGSGLSGCDRFFAVLLPEGLEEIGSMAFSSCTQLVNKSLPSSVKKIGRMAFAECDALTEFTLPESVEEMGDYVFMGCDKLEAFRWSENMSEIPAYTFLGCTSLISFGLDASKNVKKFEIPANVKTIGEQAFENTGCISVTIPSTVETMGNMVFAECKQLTTISGFGMKTIPWGTFYECVNLKTMYNCSNVETISTSSFAGCTSLPSSTTFKIPKNVLRIEYNAFQDCGYDADHLLQLEDIENWFYFEDYRGLYTEVPASLNMGLYHNTTLGRVTINHDSNYKYFIYIDNEKKAEWTKPGTYSYMLSPGEHTIYVEQQDGYAFSATTGRKTITVKAGDVFVFSGPVSNTSTVYFID